MPVKTPPCFCPANTLEVGRLTVLSSEGVKNSLESFEWTVDPTLGGLPVYALKFNIEPALSDYQFSNPFSIALAPSQPVVAGGLSTGAKAGIGVGVSLAVVGLMLLVYYVVRRRRRRAPSVGLAPDPNLKPDPVLKPELDDTQVFKLMLAELDADNRRDPVELDHVDTEKRFAELDAVTRACEMDSTSIPTYQV